MLQGMVSGESRSERKRNGSAYFSVCVSMLQPPALTEVFQNPCTGDDRPNQALEASVRVLLVLASAKHDLVIGRSVLEV